MRTLSIGLPSFRVVTGVALWPCFFLSLIVLCSACDGVGGGSSPATARQVGAFRSLRLGQTDSPNSPVATTAAANNGEAIILLNRMPGSTELVHALFVTATKDVVRITVGPDGLPVSAETADTVVNFANFTENTVQVTFTTASGDTAAVEAALPDDIIKLVASTRTERISVARALESDEVLTALFRAAIIAVKTFGCSGGSAARELSLPPSFISLADTACSSLLIDLLSALIAEGNFAERAVFGLSEISTCDFSAPNWIDDFNNALTCALGLSEQLLSTVRTFFPAIEVLLAEPTPVPTPTPVPQTTPRPQDNNEDEDEDLRCQLGKFTCANRQRVCREQLCNGTTDCEDGTDESASTCTPEVVCCLLSNGCPGESSGSCAATCCCCGVASQCDTDTYAGGCESVPLRIAPWEELSTFRKWFEGTPEPQHGSGR